MSQVINHTHTYIRYGPRRGGNPKYRCADPRCYHTIDRHALIGKESLCNLCGRTFILTHTDLQRAKPRCKMCSETKEAIEYQRVLETASELLAPVNYMKDLEEGEVENDDQRNDPLRQTNGETSD